MNNHQRQLLLIFLASIGVGVLVGLTYSLTSQLIRPGKIDVDQMSPDQNDKHGLKGQPLPKQIPAPSGSDCVVPQGGGPPVTKDFQPC